MIAQARFVRAGALCLAMATGLGLVACNGTVGSEGPSSANPLDDEENALVYELNQIRAAAGITTPIVVCASLDVSAAGHSDDMRDKMYFSDQAPDGSDVRKRACTAGYKPGCNPHEPMSELIAKGIDTGKGAVTEMNAKSHAVLVTTNMQVAGAGRTLALDGTTYWTLDLADKDDPSCH